MIVLLSPGLSYLGSAAADRYCVTHDAKDDSCFSRPFTEVTGRVFTDN